MVTEPLVNFGRVIRTVLVIIIITLIAWYAVEGRLWSYLPNVPEGDTLAKRLIDEKRSAKDCLKTYQIFPSYPPLSIARSACIETYAKLTKDTAVCELLMPSEYGLACISNLWPEVLPDDGCGWIPNNPTVYECRHDGGQLVKSKDCNAFKTYVKQYSACIEDYAERERNLEKCTDVPDAEIRSFCEVRIGAWLKYPQLRNSFYFGASSSNSSSSS